MARDAGNRFSEALDIKFQGSSTVRIRESLAEFDKLDFYRIRLSGRSNFSCFLNGLKGNADLTLFDRNGRAIAASEEDDNDAESLSRQLGTGLYFIRVNRIKGDTDYNLRFSVTQDAGDNFGKAFRVSPGKEKFKGKFIFRDAIGDDDDRSDFYRFDLASRSLCTNLLEGLRSDADITLFNSRRERIAFSNAKGFRSELISEVLEAGTYFIKIDLKSSTTITSRTQYRFKFSFKSLTIDSTDDSIGSARPIVIGPSTNLFNDFVGTDDPEDFYKVDLTSPSNLNLTLNGLSADANLQLFKSDGTLLGSSTNPGTTQDLLNQSLQAGTYFARVFPATSSTSTGYVLDFKIDPLDVFGLTDNNNLVAFNEDKLDKALNISVTGLAAGETLRSIDFRPATGELFGLSSANKLYTVNVNTGTATQVGSTAIAPALTGTSVGFDFNPTVDRIRVVSDLDENLRLNPSTGAVVDFDPITAGTQIDPALAYASSGDSGAGINPNVVTSAYTRNFTGTLTSTLFGIDTNRDVLVRQGSVDGAPISPNTGTLFTVGALGVDFGPTAGFDIFTDLNLVDTAYATSGSTLYSVNLTTGAVTSLGTVSTGTSPSSTPLNLIGLAVQV